MLVSLWIVDRAPDLELEESSTVEQIYSTAAW